MVASKKVVLLGDGAVGKTSLIRRYVFDQFDDAYVVTIGSKASKKDLVLRKGPEEKRLKLMIWDVLGREGYASLHARTFAGVHGAVLVADVTRRETLDALERYWIPLLFKVVGYVPLVFACNKSDLAAASFGLREAREIADRYNVGFEGELPEGRATVYLTSAKTGDNVEEAFENLGHMMTCERIPDDPIKELYESVVAMGVHRQSDRTTPTGALDSILVDFCEAFGDDRMAMSLIRQETVRAGIDVRNPRKERLPTLVEYLAEAETEFFEADRVVANRARRMAWAKGL